MHCFTSTGSSIHKLNADELRAEATGAAKLVIREENLKLPDSIRENDLIDAIVAEAIGLGPLEPLLEDESVTEIMVNGPDHVYVERNGKLIFSQSRFNSTASLMSIIDRIVKVYEDTLIPDVVHQPFLCMLVGN